jgi:hypothetical protein
MDVLRSVEHLIGILVGDQYRDTIVALLGALLAVVGFKTVNDAINQFVGSSQKPRARTPESSSSTQTSCLNTSSNNNNSNNNNSNNNTRTHTKSAKQNKKQFSTRTGLRNIVLGYAAYSLPKAYKMAASSPVFVDGADRIIDGGQAKLRTLVASTSSLKDDAVLDAIDRVLDGIQRKLRRDLKTAMEAAASEEQTDNNNKNNDDGPH